MCGIRLRLSLPALLLVLALPQPLFSEESYEVTEAELTKLEEILTEQSKTIERQQLRLATLSTTIEQQRKTINKLNKSLNEYEAEVTAQRVKTGAVSFGFGVGIGAFAVLILQ